MRKVGNFFSGRVKVNTPANADPLRREYLSLENAEPNLGAPSSPDAMLLSHSDGTRRFVNFDNNFNITETGITLSANLVQTITQVSETIANTNFQSVTDQGSTTTNSITVGGLTSGTINLKQNGTLVFEGSLNDAFETTLNVVNPTADRTISLPNESGTLISTGMGTSIFGTDVVTSTSYDFVAINSSGNATKVDPSDAAAGLVFIDEAIDATQNANYNLIMAMTEAGGVAGGSSTSPRALLVDNGSIVFNPSNDTFQVVGNILNAGIIGCATGIYTTAATNQPLKLATNGAGLATNGTPIQVLRPAGFATSFITLDIGENGVVYNANNDAGIVLTYNTIANTAATAIVSGTEYQIISVGTTVWSTLGASAGTTGEIFTATSNGTVSSGTGIAVETSGRKKAFVGIDRSDFNFKFIPDATVTGTGASDTEITGALGNASFNDLTLTGNLNITGDLTVSGNTVAIDATTLTIEDPLIFIGNANNSVDDGFDRGIIFNYVDTGVSPNPGAQTGFIGWDNSLDKFVLTKQTTSIVNNVVSYNQSSSDMGSLLVGNFQSFGYSKISSASVGSALKIGAEVVNYQSLLISINASTLGGSNAATVIENVTNSAGTPIKDLVVKSKLGQALVLDDTNTTASLFVQSSAIVVANTTGATVQGNLSVTGDVTATDVSVSGTLSIGNTDITEAAGGGGTPVTSGSQSFGGDFTNDFETSAFGVSWDGTHLVVDPAYWSNTIELNALLALTSGSTVSVLPGGWIEMSATLTSAFVQDGSVYKATVSGALADNNPIGPIDSIGFTPAGGAGGLEISTSITVSGDVTGDNFVANAADISGNLNVTGEVAFEDGVISLGTTNNAIADTQGRGIHFYWNDSGTPKKGFMGFRGSTFELIENATQTSNNVFTDGDGYGNHGNLKIKDLTANGLVQLGQFRARHLFIESLTNPGVNYTVFDLATIGETYGGITFHGGHLGILMDVTDPNDSYMVFETRYDSLNGGGALREPTLKFDVRRFVVDSENTIDLKIANTAVLTANATHVQIDSEVIINDQVFPNAIGTYAQVLTVANTATGQLEWVDNPTYSISAVPAGNDQIPPAAIRLSDSLGNQEDLSLIAGDNITIVATSNSITISSDNESDTLDAVTTRGAVTTNDITVGNITAGNLTLGTANSSAESTIETNGTLIIDPSPSSGNTSGLVIIKGDLQVDGQTTTVNSTELEIVDKTITIGSGSTTRALANSAGIVVGSVSSPTEISLRYIDNLIHKDGAFKSTLNLNAPSITAPKIYKTALETTVGYRTFVVTVAEKQPGDPNYNNGSENQYLIDGIPAPHLQFEPYVTYRFDQSDSSNDTHQLYFYYDRNRVTPYTTQVNIVGTAGQPGSYIEIEIGEETPSALFYQCTAHSLMGASVDIATRNLTGFSTDSLLEGTTNQYFTQARARSSFTSGTGVSINSGTISIGQNVATSASPTFTNLSVSNVLTVTQTVGSKIVAPKLEITGTGEAIVLNSNLGAAAPSANLSIIVNRGNATDAEFFWDEVNDTWKISDGTNTGTIYTSYSNDVDADTLDGQLPSYYLNYNNFTNVPTSLLDFNIADGQAGQVLQTDGNGNFSFTTVTGVSANTATNAGGYSSVENYSFTSTGSNTFGTETNKWTHVQVFVNGAQLASSQFTFDEPSGIVTLNNAPQAGAEVEIWALASSIFSNVDLISVANTGDITLSNADLYARNVYATGEVTAGESKTGTAVFSVQSTSATNTFNYVSNNYYGAKLMIFVRDNSTGEEQMQEALILTNGTSPIISSYATIWSGTNPIASYDVTATGGSTYLQITRTNDNSSLVKVQYTLLET